MHSLDGFLSGVPLLSEHSIVGSVGVGREAAWETLPGDERVMDSGLIVRSVMIWGRSTYLVLTHRAEIGFVRSPCNRVSRTDK